MSNQPKDQSKVLCYWDQDQPGGEAAAICIYQNDGFYLDGELQISPTWWEYLDEFETPNDAKLRSIIRDLRDELSRRKDDKIHRTQHCAECEQLSRELERWKPRPMSEAPRNGTCILVFERDGKEAWPIVGYWHSAPEAFLERGTRCVIADDAYGWLPIPTAEELKQIGGGK